MRCTLRTLRARSAPILFNVPHTLPPAVRRCVPAVQGKRPGCGRIFTHDSNRMTIRRASPSAPVVEITSQGSGSRAGSPRSERQRG